MDSGGPLGMLASSMPTPAYLAGLIIFSILGYAAYRYGKTASRPLLRWGGVALMVYPYAVDQTWLLYAVGTGLCAAIYALRDR